MIEYFNQLVSVLRKNKEELLLFFLGIFVSNSLSWLNLKNLCKLMKSIFKGIKKAITFVWVWHSIPLALFVVPIILLRFKLHEKGLIKLSPEKINPMIFMLFIFILLMIFSKISYKNRKWTEVGVESE